MAILTRDLMKVADNPEVKAAIKARDEALEAFRKMAKAMHSADRLVNQRNTELEEVTKRVLAERQSPPLVAEGTDRCFASSWRAPSGEAFGPGGYNRCVLAGDDHHEHRDEWGHMFVLSPKFKILRQPGCPDHPEGVRGDA